jgi:putative flavoprotein involved in K+ transport
VSHLVIEKNPRAGDSWRNRYKSLCLHDPVWYDHLPYLPFPDDWPVFAPKDKIGDWLEAYVKIMELNYWARPPPRAAGSTRPPRRWDVAVERGGQTVLLHPKELVIALGVSGYANVPKIPGAETFEGDQHHSAAGTPAPRPARARRWWCWAATTRRTTSAPRCGRTMST